MYQYKQKHAKSFYEHQNNPKLCILLVTKLLTFMFGQALETCKISILNTKNGKLKFNNFELISCQYPLMPQFYIFE